MGAEPQLVGRQHHESREMNDRHRSIRDHMDSYTELKKTAIFHQALLDDLAG